MEKKSAANAAQDFILEMEIQKVIVATGMNMRDIAKDMGYDSIDYVAKLIRMEKDGTPAPRRFVKKLREKYAAVLKNERIIKGSEKALIQNLYEQATAQQVLNNVLVRTLAYVLSKVNLSEADAELQNLLKQIREADVRKLLKS